MKAVVCVKAWPYAPEGHTTLVAQPGEVLRLEDDLAVVAIKGGFADPVGSEDGGMQFEPKKEPKAKGRRGGR